MRKVLVSLLLLLFPSVFCMASGGKYDNIKPVRDFSPDSTVCAMLGQKMADVLFCPNRVNCYTLKSKKIVELGECEVEPHWVRDSLLGRLSPQMVGILQFALIANIENYQEDSIRVKAPYVPLLEFEFQKKKDIVHVLISTADHTWTIIYNGERQMNFNYHDCELIERFCNLFIKLDE